MDPFGSHARLTHSKLKRFTLSRPCHFWNPIYTVLNWGRLFVALFNVFLLEEAWACQKASGFWLHTRISSPYFLVLLGNACRSQAMIKTEQDADQSRSLGVVRKLPSGWHEPEGCCRMHWFNLKGARQAKFQENHTQPVSVGNNWTGLSCDQMYPLQWLGVTFENWGHGFPSVTGVNSMAGRSVHLNAHWSSTGIIQGEVCHLLLQDSFSTWLWISPFFPSFLLIALKNNGRLC